MSSFRKQAIQICTLIVGLISTLCVGIAHSSKALELHIRRIAYHHVEASLLKDLREFLLPVEGFVACYGGVADERVAALDVLVQRVQLAMLLGGAQP